MLDQAKKSISKEAQVRATIPDRTYGGAVPVHIPKISVHRWLGTHNALQQLLQLICRVIAVRCLFASVMRPVDSDDDDRSWLRIQSAPNNSCTHMALRHDRTTRARI